MFNMNNQDSFIKYIMNFVRGGFIIGSVFTVFLLVNGAFNGELSIFAWHTQLSGPLGILYLVVMGPLSLAFIGCVLGLVYYAIGRAIRWCLQWFA